MLDRNVDRLFMLGDVAGPSCLQLVSVLLQYKELADSIASHIAGMNADQWTTAIGHLDHHLTLIDDVVAKCKHELRPIHDAIKG